MKGKIISRYHIKKEINLLLMKIYIIRQNYIIFKQLKFKDGCTNIRKTIPCTMKYILTALLDKIIIELSKMVVDKDKEDLSICSFIRKYEENKVIFKEQKYIYITEIDSDRKHRYYIDTNAIEKDVEELKEFLAQNDYLMKFLKKTRDKKVAHNDLKMNFNSKYIPIELKQKITYDEISSFIDGLFNRMNKIYFTLFKTQYANFNETVYNELNYLNEVLDKIDVNHN